MLLVNKATTPENTVYYIAALINGILLNNDKGIDFSGLYKCIVKTHYSNQQLNLSSYLLALDFLFLLNKIDVDKEGKLYVSEDNGNNR